MLLTGDDEEAAYHYFRGTSNAPSRTSPGASPTPSGLDDIYANELDAGWKVEGEDESAVASDFSRGVRAKFDQDRSVLEVTGEDEFPPTLIGLLDSLTASTCSGVVLFAAPSD